MINTEYKKIIVEQDNVFIEHFVLEEYQDQDYCETYTFEIFKNEIINAYKLAVKLNCCEILEFLNESIKIKMPKYTMLCECINKNIIDKTEIVIKINKLIQQMWKNNIKHLDFAFRNIGIDKNGDFQLIDLNQMRQCNDSKDFKNWISFIELDFKEYEQKKIPL
jgi:tRNA A-37 threonylcarbamoyl transferase component Bud32